MEHAFARPKEYDSGDNLQRSDLIAFEFKEKPQIDRAAREIAGEAGSDHELTVFHFAGEWFARVLVLGGSVGLPFLDRGPTTIGVPFVLDDGVFREALSNGFAVASVGVEVSGDGFRQIERHGHSSIEENSERLLRLSLGHQRRATV